MVQFDLPLSELQQYRSTATPPDGPRHVLGGHAGRGAGRSRTDHGDTGGHSPAAHRDLRRHVHRLRGTTDPGLAQPARRRRRALAGGRGVHRLRRRSRPAVGMAVLGVRRLRPPGDGHPRTGWVLERRRHPRSRPGRRGPVHTRVHDPRCPRPARLLLPPPDHRRRSRDRRGRRTAPDRRDPAGRGGPEPGRRPGAGGRVLGPRPGRRGGLPGAVPLRLPARACGSPTRTRTTNWCASAGSIPTARTP